MKITLLVADGAGGDIVLTKNRDVRTDRYVATYAIPGNVTLIAHALEARFYSQSDAGGDLVATATATFSANEPNLILTNIVLDQRIASIIVAPATMPPGGSQQLTFTAKDANNSVVAVTPGSATWTVSTGASLLTLTADGMAMAISSGVAKVRATVDGVASPDADVTIQSQFAHVFRFSLVTDTIQFKGGALNGACNLGNTFTVEAIVRPTSAGGSLWQQWTDGLMNERITFPNGKMQALGTGSGKPELFFTGNTLLLNQWNHIAWCYDGTNVKLYQNGELVQVTAAPNDFDPIAVCIAAALGKNAGVYSEPGDKSFIGDLAGFRISNVARYTGATYAQPNRPFEADGSTLALIDPSSFSTAPTTFSAPGAQGITANVGSGNASSTAPNWVAYTP